MSGVVSAGVVGVSDEQDDGVEDEERRDEMGFRRRDRGGQQQGEVDDGEADGGPEAGGLDVLVESLSPPATHGALGFVRGVVGGGVRHGISPGWSYRGELLIPGRPLGWFHSGLRALGATNNVLKRIERPREVLSTDLRQCS